MKWKKRTDLIVVIILSMAYAIVALLNAISPLHMTATGKMGNEGVYPLISFIYLVCALLITWGTYFYFQKKTGRLFSTLFVEGIVLIIIGSFLWHWIR